MGVRRTIGAAYDLVALDADLPNRAQYSKDGLLLVFRVGTMDVHLLRMVTPRRTFK